MTDNTQPEAREFTMSQYASKDDMIGAMRKRIAELESELEAVGAGGVNGPPMGRASLSANAGEPTQDAFQRALSIRTAQGWTLRGGKVPVLYTDEINGEQVCRYDVWLCTTAALAAPPTAQAEGWRPIAEHDGSACDVQLYCEDSREQFIGFPGPLVGAFQYCAFPGGTMSCRPSHWRPLPPPPTSAEGVVS